MVVESTTEKFRRSEHDLAYLCFLPPTIVSLISAVGTFVPMSDGTAGGIGFLVLIPLSLASVLSVPIGIVLSVLFRKDLALPLLSILTIVLVVEVFSEAGPPAFRNGVTWAHGIGATLVVGSWFLVRRWRRSES